VADSFISRATIGSDSLLRVATAGSVDDGKSTLIGRLLWDSKSLADDQVEAVDRASAERGFAGLNLALLTDGLRAERAQGITIDVAYRYFATPRRTFILADTPGHVEYTRNMVTGASRADLAVVLVDAQNGVVEQSRRHAVIAALLRIPHLVVAVNKMDLVDWSEERFRSIEADVALVMGRLDWTSLNVIPISALHGDNVVEPSHRMDWYTGPALLEHLETVPVADDEHESARFPVQVVLDGGDREPGYRGYSGQVAGGILRPRDDVVVLPSGQESTIASVDTLDGAVPEAHAGASVTVRLEDPDVEVQRGDMICERDDPARVSTSLDATLCWLNEEPLRVGASYLLKHTTRWCSAVVAAVRDRIDVNTLQHTNGVVELGLNDIGTVHLELSTPVVHDPYSVNRTTGSFILVDEETNATVGAGLIL
jgi:bifunctional enzyme CysN/CysC